MLEKVSLKVLKIDQAETRKLVSAFFFRVVGLLLVATSFTMPSPAAEADSLTDKMPDILTPKREGMIDQRDIIVRIVSDTIFLSDTLGETLSVTIDAQGTDISGFDFTFACDMSGVEIYDAAPGNFLDSCDWEYFIVKRNPRCNGPCPNGLVKVIALAEFRDLDRPKLCNTPAPGASLVKLLIRPTGDTPKLAAGPVRFFWVDCGDNSISSVSGNDLFISNSVSDTESGFPTSADESEFPSYAGPIPDCFNKHTINPPRRKIQFYNGTLTLMFEIPTPDSLR